MESNYRIFYLSNDVGYNLCESFTMKRKILWFFTSREIRNKGLDLTWLDLARTDLIFTDLSRLDQTTTSSRTWNLDFLIASRLDCFDSSRLEFLNFCRVSGLFLHLELPNESHELSIYRVQKRRRFEFFSLLNLIWIDLIWI